MLEECCWLSSSCSAVLQYIDEVSHSVIMMVSWCDLLCGNATGQGHVICYIPPHQTLDVSGQIIGG